MSHIIAAAGDYAIARSEDGNTVTVSVRVEKIPNKYNYGHTLENGNVSRAWARKMVREHVSPTANVSGLLESRQIGSDTWRTYLVQS